MSSFAFLAWTDDDDDGIVILDAFFFHEEEIGVGTYYLLLGSLVRIEVWMYSFDCVELKHEGV